jgi:tetratricopeptide (TPR) repeat protein
MIGPYKLVEQIGDGGMGTVWIAQQTEPVKRLVAVKVLKAGMDSRQVIARFEAERQALAIMDHANIARVLDAGTASSGRPYFVMDLVKGMPITNYCDEHQLTLRQRLELFIPVCQAVQHAHQKGIIHRDLKPSNVLVACGDPATPAVPKVIDFGVAKAIGQQLAPQTLVTGMGTIVGTLEYMSPEQARLTQLDIDTRSDIYSLGVLLYELLAGRPPFTRKQLEPAGMLEMLRVIREQEPPKPSVTLASVDCLPTLAAQRGTEPAKLAKQVRGELDWIVLKALEKDRNRRYETAAGLASDLQRYMSNEPVVAGPPTAWYRLRKFGRRHRGAMLAVTLISMSLVGGVVGTGVGLVQAKVAESNAVQEAIQKRTERDRAVKAELEAMTQAELTRSVNAFLQYMLSQADVGSQPRSIGGVQVDRNPNLTVRELLDRFSKNINGKSAGNELVEAAILHTIGDAYFALGEYAEAKRHLQRSVELRTDRLGRDHLDTLNTKQSLACVHYAQARYEDAASVFQEVLEGNRAHRGVHHRDTLEVKQQFAIATRELGDLTRCEQLLREVLDHTSEAGADDHFILLCKHELAQTYVEQRKLEQAEALAIEALDGFTKLLGTDHPHTLICMNDLAWICHQQDKYNRAEHLYLQAIAGQTSMRRPDHPDTLTSKQNLADMYIDQELYEKSEPLLNEVLAARLLKLAPDHPHTLATKFSLGVLYLGQHRYGESVPLFEELLRIRQKNPGDDPPPTVVVASYLAENYKQVGRVDDALALIDEWWPRGRDKFGLMHPRMQYGVQVARSLYEQVPGHGGIASPKRAEEFFQELLAAQTAELGADNRSTLATMSGLAGLYWRQKRFADSVPLFEQELAMRRNRWGDDDKANLVTAFNLVVNYCDGGRGESAALLVDEWLPRARDTLNFDDMTMQFAVAASLHAYKTLGKLDKTELLQRDIAEFWKSKAGPESIEYAKQLGLLSVTLVDERKWTDAESLLRQCLAIRRAKEPDEWLTFSVQSWLGKALLGQERYADAEPLLVDAFEKLKERETEIPTAARVVFADTLQHLVQLYDGWGKEDEAAKWRKTLEDYRKVSSDVNQ